MMKIVVRMPNWIGDAVMALPVLDALRSNFPQAELWVAAREWVGDLFSPEHGIKGLVPLPQIRDLKSLRQASSRLRKHGFDIGLLLTNSFSSALVFRLAGIPKRWGYARDGRGFLLSRSVPLKNGDPTRHQTDTYKDLLAGLGIEVSSCTVDLHLTEEEKTAAGKAMTEAGRDPARPLVVLNPGAAYGPAKRWPAERFADLARLFQARKNAEILLVGAAGETDIAASIASGLERKPLDFTGKTSLRQLMGLISLGRVFVTNDTGPMHIADALGVPVVAIFGPTDPKASGPSRRSSVVLKTAVPCWPCTYRSCPYDHRCMNGIGPEEVFEAGRGFL
jgi:heptosyltransferase-2